MSDPRMQMSDRDTIAFSTECGLVRGIPGSAPRTTRGTFTITRTTIMFQAQAQLVFKVCQGRMLPYPV